MTWPDYRCFLGKWDADIDLFQEASRQGCRRCAVAFDMVTTWMEGNSRSDRRHITVKDTILSEFKVADVHVYFSASRNYWRDDTEYVLLELLSANRRCPK